MSIPGALKDNGAKQARAKPLVWQRSRAAPWAARATLNLMSLSAVQHSALFECERPNRQLIKHTPARQRQ